MKSGPWDHGPLLCILLLLDFGYNRRMRAPGFNSPRYRRSLDAGIHPRRIDPEGASKMFSAARRILTGGKARLGGYNFVSCNDLPAEILHERLVPLRSFLRNPTPGKERIKIIESRPDIS